MSRLDVEGILHRLADSSWMLERVGRGWLARCPSPDHDDAHPSWRIVDDPGSDRHGSHHCQACKFGGGPWELAAAVWGVDLLEAGRRLHDGGYVRDGDTGRAEVSVGGLVARHRRSGLVPVPAGVVVPRTPSEWPVAPLDYLTSRGVGAVQAARWGIGYAASGPLAGRIWSPIRDWRGRLEAWSARDYLGRVDHRVVGDGSRCGSCGARRHDHAPRYMEATQQVCARCGLPRFVEALARGRACACGSYHLVETRKSQALFGLTRAVPFDCVVFVAEGVWSVLALERAGARSVLGLLGSHVESRGMQTRLHRLATWDTIVVATDPDPAGDAAYQELCCLEGYDGRARRVVRLRLSASPDDCEHLELRDAIARFS